MRKHAFRHITVMVLAALALTLGAAACSSGSSQPTPAPPTAAPKAASAAPPAPAATQVAQAGQAEPTRTPKPTKTPEPTEAPLLPPVPAKRPLTMNSPEYGVQAFLWWRPELAERDLLKVKELGFTWVKQGFGWRDIEHEKGKYDWSNADHVVYTANKYGNIDIVARVDHQPEWARSGCSLQGPPANMKDFTDFLTAMATRYKGRIRAYEIWNEPNLAREWCDQRPDPKAYAAMLKAAYAAIKAADPDAMVISAGLSPTGTNDQTATPDDVYLDQLYQAMGGKSDGYFDVLGVHAPGYKAAPEVSPDEAAANKAAYGGERFFTFRRVEDLRKIMEKYGDTKKQVAVLEMGWTSDEVNPAYKWHAVSEEQKADYLKRAYQFAQKNWSPWIGLMTTIYIADPDWTDKDEQYWWAITDPDGTPRPAFGTLKDMPKAP
ncbi:MAG: cellulase family glycosylhydrolase [Anaerolineae bacterium]